MNKWICHEAAWYTSPATTTAVPELLAVMAAHPEAATSPAAMDHWLGVHQSA